MYWAGHAEAEQQLPLPAVLGCCLLQFHQSMVFANAEPLLSLLLRSTLRVTTHTSGLRC